MGTDEKIITNSMRQDQMKMLDIYFTCAEEDETLIKFLETLNKRLTDRLEELKNAG